MARTLEPFKIELLIPTERDLQGIRPVEVLAIMESFSKNFHPQGLFSVELFGKVGEERRSRTFSYINLHVKVFHPLIFKVLCDLKELYAEIMSGKTYAIFDTNIKDFVKSNVAEGDTGYAFFLKHFPNLQFEQRPSIARKEYIRFIEKHRDNPFIEQLIVMPAGLRDYVVDPDGKPSEDEINGMYRSIMAVAGTMENVNVVDTPEYIDASRFNLQVKLLELYRYLIGLLIGKHKMVQGAWMARKVSDTSRNVITSYIPTVQTLGDERGLNPNGVIMGLYQFLRNIIPLTVKHVSSKYAKNIFIGANAPAYLTDKKTLRKVMVDIKSSTYDSWMTYEGIEKIADKFSVNDLRHYPIDVEGYWLGLIYKGPDGTFRFMQDIDELPAGRDKKHVTPITMAEYLYMCVYEEAKDAYAFTTRYPISGYGSTYPGQVVLATTVVSEIRTELDENWRPLSYKALAFPITGKDFLSSLVPAPSHVARMGADFDGDAVACYNVWTQQSKDEVKRILKSRDYYLNIDGTMAFSQEVDYAKLALQYMTKF